MNPTRPRHRHDAVRACLALASLAVIGCSTEQISSPRPSDSPSFAAGGKKAKPTISGVSGPTSLTIGGSAGTYTVEISNQTSAIYSNTSLQASIDQGMGTSQPAANVAVVCGAGGLTGVIPPGGCVMTIPIAAANGAGGTGSLVPGNAKIVVNLVQGGTILDTRSLRISLVAQSAPYISSLVTSFSDFVAGTAQDYTITLTNPTNSNQSILVVQAYFVQNGTFYAGSGTNVLCTTPETSGNLPPGNCTFTSQTAMANPRPAPGSATWRLELTQTTTAGTVLLDYRELPVIIQ